MSAPLILGTNSIKDVGYNVDNSLRFDDGSNDFLSFTQGTATSRKTFSISVWVKRANLSAQQQIFETWLDNNNRTDMQFTASDKILLQQTLSGSTSINIETSRLFRDVSAWYHILAVFDTTESTASDRVKLYINGVQETSFSPATYPSLNADLALGTSSYTNFLGKYSSSGGNYFDGYMAEYVFTDGTALSNTDVGEFDEDSGIWKPIDVSGLTFGTNGFYLDFEDSSALGNDVSGNNNDFTVNNLTSIDQTTDTCTNNFATLNSLDNYYAGGTFAQGNTYYTSVSSKHDFTVSNFGMASGSGKFYAEFKVHQDTDYNAIGISDHGYQGSNQELSEDNYSYAYINYDATNSIVRGNGGTILSSMPLFGNGDIIGVALDLENHKLYFSKNGTFINSGDPTSGSTGTGAVSIQDLSSVSSSYGQGVYFFGVGLWNSSASGSYSANFGNPPFTISSGNSDGNGYGNFEYSVPSGYYALNTKNLAEYG